MSDRPYYAGWSNMSDHTDHTVFVSACAQCLEVLQAKAAEYDKAERMWYCFEFGPIMVDDGDQEESCKLLGHPRCGLVRLVPEIGDTETRKPPRETRMPPMSDSNAGVPRSGKEDIVAMTLGATE